MCHQVIQFTAQFYFIFSNTQLFTGFAHSSFGKAVIAALIASARKTYIARLPAQTGGPYFKKNCRTLLGVYQRH